MVSFPYSYHECFLYLETLDSGHNPYECLLNEDRISRDHICKLRATIHFINKYGVEIFDTRMRIHHVKLVTA